MRKSFLRKAIWFAIPGIVLASLLPNIFSDYWLIDIFSNFKLQYLFISILLVIISSFLLKKKFLALSLIVLSMLWNAYFIAPYYINSNDFESNNKKLKISNINLLSSNTETGLVKNYIRKENPDILVLLEFTQRWEGDLLSIIENYPHVKLVTRADNFVIIE